MGRLVCLDRANTISGARYASNAHPVQGVVNIHGNRRDAKGIHDLIDYVGRVRAKDRGTEMYGKVRFHDLDGRDLGAAATHGHVSRNWQVVEDSENLSARAEALLLAGRHDLYEGLTVKERLRHVQGWHMTLSLVYEQDEQDRREEDRAVFDEIVARTMTGCMFEGLLPRHMVWGVHDDEPHRIHAHVVISNVDPDTGRRLGSDLDIYGDRLDAIRAEFAKAARSCGVRVVAERREDREEMRARIMRGEEPLRTRQKMVHAKKKTDLSVQAPLWFIRHGPAYAKRRRKARDRRRHLKWDAFAPVREHMAQMGIIASHPENLDVAIARAEHMLDEAVRHERDPADHNVIQSDELTAASLRREAFRQLKRNVGVLARRAQKEDYPEQPALLQRVLNRRQADVDEGLREVFEEIRGSFVDPVKALNAWADMAREGSQPRGGDAKRKELSDDRNSARDREIWTFPNKALANWWMRYHPDAFGEITRSATGHLSRARLQGALKRAVLPAPTPELHLVLPKRKDWMAAKNVVDAQNEDVREADRVGNVIGMLKSFARLVRQVEEVTGRGVQVRTIETVMNRLNGSLDKRGGLGNPVTTAPPNKGPTLPRSIGRDGISRERE